MKLRRSRKRAEFCEISLYWPVRGLKTENTGVIKSLNFYEKAALFLHLDSPFLKAQGRKCSAVKLPLTVRLNEYLFIIDPPQERIC